MIVGVTLIQKRLKGGPMETICMNIKACFLGKIKNISNLSSADFVCVEVLQPSQPNGVMSSAVSLPNHTFTGQA